MHSQGKHIYGKRKSSSFDIKIYSSVVGTWWSKILSKTSFFPWAILRSQSLSLLQLDKNRWSHWHFYRKSEWSVRFESRRTLSCVISDLQSSFWGNVGEQVASNYQSIWQMFMWDYFFRGSERYVKSEKKNIIEKKKN